MTFDFSTLPEPSLLEVRLLSPRLVLRPVVESDAPVIFQEFSPAITHYMIPKAAEHIEESLAFIRASEKGMRAKRELVCAILEKPSGDFAGCCGLHLRATWEEPELGIWIRAGVHRKGYGREAVKAMAEWAFQHLSYPNLIYPVDRNNLASRRIPESMGGFEFAEKLVLTQRGTTLDEVVYKIPRF